MIVFELSMPNKGSWNGKWSQEGQLFVRTRREYDVPKEYWDKSFCHHWDDGWTSCVTTTRMSANEARKLERKSKGFCGYDWMITSIIKYGEIKYRKEWDREKDAIKAWNRRAGDNEDDSGAIS